MSMFNCYPSYVFKILHITIKLESTAVIKMLQSESVCKPNIYFGASLGRVTGWLGNKSQNPATCVRRISDTWDRQSENVLHLEIFIQK